MREVRGGERSNIFEAFIVIKNRYEEEGYTKIMGNEWAGACSRSNGPYPLLGVVSKLVIDYPPPVTCISWNYYIFGPVYAHFD